MMSTVTDVAVASTQSKRRGGKKPGAGRPKGSRTKRPALPTRRVSYPTEGLATVADASMFLRVSKFTIYKLIKDGKLERIPLGDSNTRIRWADLHRLAKTL